MTLQAFDGYWGPAPHEKLIELAFNVDAKRGVAKLVANQTDLVTNLPPAMVKEIEAHDQLWVDSILGSSVLFMVLNVNRPPFDNSIVREAIVCAIDRSTVAEAAFFKYARPVSQLVSASAWGYAPKVPAVTRDLTRARALVSAVAGEGGIPFTLEIGDFREGIGRLLSQQLSEASFRVDLRLKPGPEVLVDILNGSIQAGVQSYLSPLGDAGPTFAYIVHSQSSGAFKTAASTPDIDRLIEASQDTLDPDARQALLFTIAERLAQRRGLVPLVAVMELYGARRELQWKPNAGWAIPLATASRRGANP
jgi:ABC-type transport system substrate-binding protein